MVEKYIALFDDNLRSRKSVRRSDLESYQIGAALRTAYNEVPPAPRIEVFDSGPSQIGEIAREPGFVAGAESIPTALIYPVEASGDDVRAGSANYCRPVQRSEFKGRGCKVAVLDTGIDVGHSAFQGIAIDQVDFTGEGKDDLNGHGTHCAGIFFGRKVDGIAIGVAPDVSSVFVGKVLDSSGRGTTAALFNGLLAAVFKEGANVVSVSIQYSIYALIRELQSLGISEEVAANRAFRTVSDNLRLFEKFVELARYGKPGDAAGTLLICAAGNQSMRDKDTSFIIPAAFPGNVQGVICCAALNMTPGSCRVASFSNSMPTLSAPGVEILSAAVGGGLIALSGTSMACPYVAGAAAQWWEKASIAHIPDTGKVGYVLAKLIGSCKSDVIDGYTFTDCGAGLVEFPS